MSGKGISPLCEKVGCQGDGCEGGPNVVLTDEGAMSFCGKVLLQGDLAELAVPLELLVDRDVESVPEKYRFSQPMR